MIGPVFQRELSTTPRRGRFFAARAIYVGSLFLLVSTGWMVVTGTQQVRNLGDIARFGSTTFQLLAPLQLALALFFSALFAASAVAQEKDRRTLVLLLLSDLSNVELVVGKLLASMLNVLVLLAAAVPLLVILMLFGGIATRQIADVVAVTVTSAFVAGSTGSLLAYWRQKTFQSLALTVLVLVAWLALGGAIWLGLLGTELAGISCQGWATALSPLAVFTATLPFPPDGATFPLVGSPVTAYVVFGLTAATLLNLITVARVRVWNPSRSRQPRQAAAERESLFGENNRSSAAQEAAAVERPLARGKHRRVWNQPVVWREIRTKAYGRKMAAVRAAYLILFALGAMALNNLAYSEAGLGGESVALILAPLVVLSLVLINAQAVTSITTERDGRSLDVLLATDVSPKEFVYGKLGGVFYNTKEMAMLPVVLCIYLGYLGAARLEDMLYVIGGLIVLEVFVAMLGLHVGMAYPGSRTAVGVSLGTVFFLFVGVATCMRIMVAFSGNFTFQLMPFLGFMVGGGVGLYVALGMRNPSQAIGWASLACPFMTFWAIASYMQDMTLGVFIAVLVTYGFTTMAMLVPAISEFDVAMGRTTQVAE